MFVGKSVVVCRSCKNGETCKRVWFAKFKRQRKSTSLFWNWANQDSSGTAKKQTLADYRAEMQKHEFQADYDRRNIQNKMKFPVSTEWYLSCSSRRRTTSRRSTTFSWTIIGTKSRTSWSSWEKSQWDGRIEAISRLYIRYNFKDKIDRRSRHYPWTHWQDTGISKWNQLYERCERFSKCWISTQWTVPRYQSTSAFPTSSNS